MKTFSQLIFIVVTFTYSLLADDQEFTVTKVGVSQNSKTFFVVTGEPANTNLTVASKYWFRWNEPTCPDVYKEMYATALSALSMGKRLQIYWNENGPTLGSCLQANALIIVP